MWIWEQVGDWTFQSDGKLPDDVEWGALSTDFEIDDGRPTQPYQVA